MRAPVRASLTLLGIAALVPLILVLLALGATHFGPARHYAIERTLAFLNQDVFGGRLTVEGSSGGLLTALEFEGVTVHAPDGSIPIEVQQVVVEPDWSRLFTGELAAERVRVRGGRVALLEGRGGELNVVSAFTSSTATVAEAPEPNAEPARLFAPVVAPDVRIERVHGLVPGGAAPLYVELEYLQASFHLSRAIEWRVTGADGRGFTPRAGGFGFTVAEARGQRAFVAAREARIELDGGSRIELGRGHLEGAEGPALAVAFGHVTAARIEAAAGLAAPSGYRFAAMLARPWPGGPLAVEARVAPDVGGRLAVFGALGDRLALAAQGDLPTRALPSTGALRAAAQLELFAVGRVGPLEDLDARAKVRLRARGPDLAAFAPSGGFVSARAQLAAREGLADGRLVVSSTLGAVQVDLRTPLAPKGPRTLEGTLSASVSGGLDDLAPGLTIGGLAATATVGGAVKAPVVDASAAVTDVRWRKLRAKRVEVRGAARGLEHLDVQVKSRGAELEPPRGPRLRARVSARRRGPEVSGRARLALEGVGQARAEAGGDWAALTGLSRARDLLEALTRARAQVEVDDLGTLSSFGGPSLEGRAQAELRLREGRARAEVDAYGVRAASLEGDVDAHFDVVLEAEATRLVATASVAGRPALGLAARVDEPFDRLDLDRLEQHTRFELDLSRFPLAILPGGLGGQLEGRVHGQPGPKRPSVQADLRLEEVHLGAYAPRVAGTITATVGALAQVQAHLRSDVAGAVELSAELAVPELDVAGTPARWLDGVRRAELRAPRLDLGVLSGTFDGPDLEGEAALSARVDAGGRRARAWLGVEDVAAPLLDGRISGDVVLTAGPQQTSADGFFARAGGFAPMRGLLTVSGTTARGLRGWLDPEAPLAQTPLGVRVFAPALPLTLLSPPRRHDPPDVEGTVTISAKLGGTIAAPELEASLEGRRLSLDETYFHGVQADLTWRSDAIASSGRMQQADGRLSWTFVDDGDGARLELEAKGFDVAFASAFLPDERAAIGGFGGLVDADLELSGSFERPRAEGYLRVKEGRTVVIGPVPPVTKTDARLELDDTDVHLEADGRSGGGDWSLEIGGPAVPLEDLDLSGELDIDGVQLVTAGRLVEIDELRVKLSVAGEEGGVEARARLYDGNVELPGEQVSSLHPIEELDKIRVVGPDGLVRVDEETETASTAPKRGLDWGLNVDTDDPISVRGPQVNGAAEVDVGVRGTPAGPILGGRIRLTEGEVDLLGRRWRVTRGALLFAERRPVSPELDVTLEHSFPSATVQVLLRGTVNDPDLELTSDPPIYDDAQLMSLLLTGSPGGGPGGGQGASLEAEAGGAAVGLLLGELQKNLRSRLPVDALSVQVGAGAQVDRVAVGRWITSRLFVAYGFRPAAEEDENANEVRVRWRIGSGWVLEGTYGDANNGGADLLWLKRW